MTIGKAVLAALGVTTSMALVALCCGLTLAAAALVVGGATAWLAVHGLLLALPVVVLATALLVWRRAKRAA